MISGALSPRSHAMSKMSRNKTARMQELYMRACATPRQQPWATTRTGGRVSFVALRNSHADVAGKLRFPEVASCSRDATVPTTSGMTPPPPAAGTEGSPHPPPSPMPDERLHARLPPAGLQFRMNATHSGRRGEAGIRGDTIRAWGLRRCRPRGLSPACVAFAGGFLVGRPHGNAMGH